MKVIYESISKFILLVIYFELVLFLAPTIFKILSFIIRNRHRQRMLYSGAKSIIKLRKRINSNISYILKNIITRGFSFNFGPGKERILSKEKLLTKLINDTPEEFENFCGQLYKNLGYKVTVMPEGPDGGKDVIAIDKSNNKIYIECKRYHPEKGGTIGREICQKLIGSCAIDSVCKAIVFTTGKIHNNAYNYQAELNSKGKFKLELVNYDKIYDLYRESAKVKRNDSREEEKFLGTDVLE